MAIDNGKEPELGAATPDGLAKTATAEMGTYSDPSLPDHRRFLMTAVEVVRRRRAQPDGETDQKEIAVFLLCDRVGITGKSHNGALEPLFKDGTSELTGRLWFTTVEMNTGYRRELPEKDDGVVFSFIENELVLGDVPAVVFDPRPLPPVFRLYPKGVANPDMCERHELKDYEVNAENLIATLNGFYETQLKTPDCAPTPGKLWRDADKWIPIPMTEGEIQVRLKSNLGAAFPNCEIRHEYPTDEGRADIIILQLSKLEAGAWVYLAALELKVLRSFTSGRGKVSPTVVAKAVKKGLRQAIAFRTVRKARNAVLCCYDMRNEDTGEVCFEPIGGCAEKYDIELKRWYLYNSSETFRQATYPI